MDGPKSISSGGFLPQAFFDPSPHHRLISDFCAPRLRCQQPLRQGFGPILELRFLFLAFYSIWVGHDPRPTLLYFFSELQVALRRERFASVQVLVAIIEENAPVGPSIPTQPLHHPCGILRQTGGRSLEFPVTRLQLLVFSLASKAIISFLQ